MLPLRKNNFYERSFFMYSDDYDGSFRNSSDYGQQPGSRRSNGLATASLVLGIISLLSTTIFYIAVPCGALAILFALLSRGNGKMYGKCKAAIVMGIAGGVSSIIMIVGAFYMLMNDPEMLRDFEYLFNLYTDELGLDYDFDDLEEMFGIENDDSHTDESDENDYYNQFWSDFYSDEQNGHSDDWYDHNESLPYGNDSSKPDIPSGGDFI